MSDTDVSFKRLAAVLVFVVMIAFVMFFGVVGYFDYRVDQGKQAACEKEFGQGAEWVGLTSDLNGVICQTPDDELHAADTLGQPQGTFIEYLSSWGIHL